MNRTLNQKNEIKGWGVDADPARRPAYPYWSKPEGGTGAHWDVPEQQPGWKDFHSIEHPHHTHVFGTAPAPMGLSGLIRGFAFRYSESSWGHWLPLMLADRVNVVEGIFMDLLKGKIPNPYKEMGLSSEWKYNRKSFVLKTSLAAVVFAVPLFLLLSNRTKPAAPVARRTRTPRAVR